MSGVGREMPSAGDERNESAKAVNARPRGMDDHPSPAPENPEDLCTRSW